MQHIVNFLVNTVDLPIIRAADMVVAAGAITFPWWRQELHEWSAVVADVTPFFGVMWLMVQIVAKVIDLRKKKRAARAARNTH